MKYSSMSDYLDAVKKDAKKKEIKWGTKTGDFWQYNLKSKPNAYWTGYFTTHPDFKGDASAYGDFA